MKAYKEGVQAAFKGDTRTAIRQLESALKREPNFVEALVELGGIAYNAKGYARAETLLARAAALQPDPSGQVLYGLAMSEFKQEKYAEAAEHLQRGIDAKKFGGDRAVAAGDYLAQARFREAALANPIALELHRLPSAINTAEDAEYLPSLTADGAQLVFTRRIAGRDEDFFIAARDSLGDWLEARPIDGVNTLENEGAQAVSADGKLIVFTACNRKGGLGSCDLYYSRLRDGRWSEPANMGAPINTRAWESQPSLAANGNLLFFASRRPGGLGGADLYASGRAAGGGWSEPINLGDIVNTRKDDQAPFFHADGKTLYFMSEGHAGMGGFDLFVTHLGDDNKWTEPINLGYPLNTSDNEGAIAVALDGQTAYYATDAAAVAGGDSIGVGGTKTGLTDLYSFTLPPAARAGVVTYVRATVVDADTDLPLPAAATFADAADDRPFLRKRAREADGQFLAVLPAGKTYSLSVEHPGYLFYSDRFELNEPNDATRPFELRIPLQPVPAPVVAEEGAAPTTGEPIVLRNVLFATASAELLPDSRAELNRLAALLATNPTLRIELRGHTDDVGEEADNQQLSERRAAAVRDYLVANGIDTTRLRAVGFGESRPLIEATDAEARAVNRRTEFIVL